MKRLTALVLTMMMTLAILTGCGNKSQSVMTIEGNEVPLGEAVFLLREMEKMYETAYGEQVWTMGQGGESISDIAKSTSLDTLKRLFITDLEAKSKDIALDEDEQKELEKSQEEALAEYTDEQLKADNITKEDVEQFYYYNAIADKMMDIETTDLEIDQELIDSQLAGDENYQYIQQYGYEGVMEKVTVQHILIMTINEDGTEKTDEEKEDALARATEVLELVKAGEIPFEELVSQYSEDTSKEQNLGQITFQKGMMVPAFEEAAFAMDVDEISDLVLTEYGYHIIKKLDHTYPTEEEVQQVMEYESNLKEQYELQQKQDAFYNKYLEWEKNYTIEVNDDVWSKILTSYEQNNQDTVDESTTEDTSTEGTGAEETDGSSDSDAEGESEVTE